MEELRLAITGQRTDIWMTKEVFDFLDSYKRVNKLDGTLFNKEVGKLKKWCDMGLKNVQGVGYPVKHEWDEVYRIAVDGKQFRIVGFFSQNNGIFHAITFFEKKKQKLDARMRAVIDKVAAIKKDADYKCTQDKLWDTP